MSSAFKVLTPPSVEPISLVDAKAYLRVDFPDDDAVIANIIARARSFAETVTGRALATQVIRQTEVIERPNGGELSGPIAHGPSWYQYSEMIGANPFGATQFYYTLAMPPIQVSQPIAIETKVVAFDTWKTFPQVTNPDGSTNTWVNDDEEPARIFIQDPITANFWRFTYTAGYNSSYPITPDILQPIYESIDFWYNNREAEDLPQYLLNKLLAKRVDWV